MPNDVVLSAKRIQVKTADEADYDRIIEFSKSYSGNSSIAPHNLRTLKKEARTWLFVETDKQEILAIASLNRSVSAPSATIEYFLVRKDARGHRIGPLFLSAILKYCRETYKDIESIMILPLDESWWKGDNVRILRKMGFEKSSKYEFKLYFKKYKDVKQSEVF